MSNHFIHYIKRKVYIRKPASGKEWFATPQKLGAGFESPVYHITRSKKGVVENIREGDTIWLISELKTPWGKLPPALDAKIVVREVCPFRNGQRKFIADTALSQWFPLANCMDILSKLETETKTNEIHSLISDSVTNKQIGIFLQSIRKLHSANELVNWAEQIHKKPFHFISYRIKDGTECAFNKAKELMEANEVVFWDRWSLPRRLAERREKTSGIALNNRLLKKIDEADIVWGIESKLYSAKGSYSQKEYLKAYKLGKYCNVCCQQGK